MGGLSALAEMDGLKLVQPFGCWRDKRDAYPTFGGVFTT